jgi:hypothetical protein
MPKPNALIALEITFGAALQRSVLSVGLVTIAALAVKTAPWTRGLPSTHNPCPELSNSLIADALPERISCEVLFPSSSTALLEFKSENREPDVDRQKSTSPVA